MHCFSENASNSASLALPKYDLDLDLLDLNLGWLKSQESISDDQLDLSNQKDLSSNMTLAVVPSSDTAIAMKNQNLTTNLPLKSKTHVIATTCWRPPLYRRSIK